MNRDPTRTENPTSTWWKSRKSKTKAKICIMTAISMPVLCLGIKGAWADMGILIGIFVMYALIFKGMLYLVLNK